MTAEPISYSTKRQIQIVLSSLLLLAFASSCGSDKKEDPGYNWAALPSATPVVYTRGATELSASAIIDAAGGTLEGPVGTPIEGVTVSIPAGAVATPTTFSLGYDVGGSFANIADDERPSVVLSIESDGAREFSEPITVTFPFTDATRVPVPYLIKEDGTFELMRPLPIDRDAGRAGFVTWHLSDYGWVNKDPLAANQPVWNGFNPSTNGFAFANTIQDPYVPNGRCWGISMFTAWYKRTQGEGLGSRFTDLIPTNTSAEQSITGQEVIATRAQISVALNQPETSGMTQMAAILYIQDALARGASSVMVGLGQQVGDTVRNTHAVLAIGFTDTQIAVYDSNWPKRYKAIDYTFDGTTNATIEYGDRDVLDVWGSGPPALTEKLEDILRDAEKSFSNENQTKIEVTSHATGDTVVEENVTLEGKVHSGEVSIAVLEVSVIHEDDATFEDAKTVTLEPGEEDFTVDLKMKSGNNTVVFVTRGYVTRGDFWREIPNDRGVPPNDEFGFTLKFSAPPESSLFVSGTWSEDTTDSGGVVQSRREGSEEFSTNLSYRLLPGTVRRIQAGDFPFELCTTAGCAVMAGQNTPSMSQDTPLLSVYVKYSARSYLRNSQSGQLELSTVTEGTATSSWQEVNVEIDVEPLCTADSRRYRFRVYPGCNNDLCAPSWAPRVTIQCCSDGGASCSPCGEGLLTVPYSHMLTLMDNADLDTITPPRLSPSELEPFILGGTESTSWSMTAAELDDTVPNMHTEGSYGISLTLVP